MRNSSRGVVALMTAVWAVAAFGQSQPAVLEYTGKPLTLPFQCSVEDMDWGGLTCTEEDPCPVYLEVAGVESSGKKLVAAGNIHAAAVTLYSVLLGSSDGGRTWKEVHDRIRGAGLDHIQFANESLGWVSGQTLSPLPRDPFLLLTTDGGDTWRQSPIGSEIGRGTIQQFGFVGKAGSLLLDRGAGDGRYALYESSDGGETWTPREESNKPIRLKQPASTPGWRVRADGTTKAFLLERRQGERWQAAASFAVNVGACKPPHVEDAPLPEPEYEPPPPPPLPAKKRR